MKKVSFTANVELSLPDALDMLEYDLDGLFNRQGTAKMALHLSLKDVVLRIPTGPVGNLGRLTTDDAPTPSGDHKTITIKNLVVQQIVGIMLPVLNKYGAVAMFDTDAPEVVLDCIEVRDGLPGAG